MHHIAKEDVAFISETYICKLCICFSINTCHISWCNSVSQKYISNSIFLFRLKRKCCTIGRRGSLISLNALINNNVGLLLNDLFSWFDSFLSSQKYKLILNQDWHQENLHVVGFRGCIMLSCGFTDVHFLVELEFLIFSSSAINGMEFNYVARS